jgi:uncharacterized C2H2 Zn-finger protein
MEEPGLTAPVAERMGAGVASLGVGASGPTRLAGMQAIEQLVMDAGRGYSWELACYGPPLPPALAERRLKLNMHLHEFDKIEYWEERRIFEEREAAELRRAEDLRRAEAEAADAREKLRAAEARVVALGGTVSPAVQAVVTSTVPVVPEQPAVAGDVGVSVEVVVLGEAARRLLAAAPPRALRPEDIPNTPAPPVRVPRIRPPRQPGKRRPLPSVVMADGGVVCSACNKHFIRESELRQHMRYHLRDVVCSECGKSYADGKELARHAASTHGKKELFHCTCGNDFSRRDNITRHVRKKGGTHALEYWVDSAGTRRAPDEVGQYGLVRPGDLRKPVRAQAANVGGARKVPRSGDG